jgi:ribonuclease D
VLRDEALLEIAAHPPERPEDLHHIRSISQGFSQSRAGKALLEAVERGRNRADDTLPQVKKKKTLPRGIGPLVDLLKVLLKMKCEKYDVAQKLIANVADLERIAADDYDDVKAMSGWRFEVFGEDALKLKRGELALAAEGRKIELVELDD